MSGIEDAAAMNGGTIVNLFDGQIVDETPDGEKPWEEQRGDVEEAYIYFCTGKEPLETKQALKEALAKAEVDGEEEGFYAVAVPYPSVGGAAFATDTNFHEAMNANGIMVSQKIGQDIIGMELGWDIIEAEDWWRMGRMFRKHGNVVWCRYFDHETGEWLLKQFRRYGRQCNPMLVEADGKPVFYEGASISVKSVGD